jgi:hypothetical protein
VLLQKAKPAMCEGNRNPHGTELLSAGAERGNCPEAKPNRKGADRRTQLRVSQNSRWLVLRKIALLLALRRSV